MGKNYSISRTLVSSYEECDLTLLGLVLWGLVFLKEASIV